MTSNTRHICLSFTLIMGKHAERSKKIYEKNKFQKYQIFSYFSPIFMFFIFIFIYFLDKLSLYFLSKKHQLKNILKIFEHIIWFIWGFGLLWYLCDGSHISENTFFKISWKIDPKNMVLIAKQRHSKRFTHTITH